MRKLDIKTIIPHITAVVLFAIISLVYFYPVLEGYKLKQGDLEKHKAMAHEIRSHQEKYDTPALWSGNMFAGMPTYMTGGLKYDGITSFLFQLYRGGLPHPASAVFAYLLGFFILLRCLGVNKWLSIVGSIAFSFSSYFFIIIEAGHSSKTYAIALMAPILGGFIQAIRGNLRIGLILIVIFTSLQIYVNHLQITYYLFLVLVFVGIGELITFYKKKEIKAFVKRLIFIVLAAFLGILPNIGKLLMTYDYAKSSIRGESDLTILPNGDANSKIASSGLDKDYITQWSNGIDETLTLLIPNAKGGSSHPILAKEEELERIRKEDPKFFNTLVSEYQNNNNVIGSYFGNQPIVSGPVYVGILIVFLSILSLICIANRFLISLALVTILGIMLSWGKNFMGLTEIFIDFLPGYNKFRAVAMILLIAEFTMPIMAILFLDRLLKDKDFFKQQQKKILYTSMAFIVFIGITVINPSTFIELSSDREQESLENKIALGNTTQAYAVYDQIIDYRAEIVSDSASRSLIILLIGIVILIFFIQGKLKANVFITLIGLLILGDLWSIDKEYVNNRKNVSSRLLGKYASWVETQKYEVPFEPSAADLAIFSAETSNNLEIEGKINERLKGSNGVTRRGADKRRFIDVQYSELMESTHYRVLNTLARLDQDVRTPYFHKTLGGYHGAKLRKYQELIDFHLVREHYALGQGFSRGGQQMVNSMLPSAGITNMLNAKYIIGSDNTGKSQATVIANPYALGNAWFVNDIKIVENADSAILALRQVDLSSTVIVERGDENLIEGKTFTKNNSTIELNKYDPNELVYKYESKQEALAVFSEIYYSPGWKVFLNGKEGEFFKVNYTLRGMVVPSGSGEIIFKFDPSLYKVGKILSWLSSIIILLLISFVGYYEFKERTELKNHRFLS